MGYNTEVSDVREESGKMTKGERVRKNKNRVLPRGKTFQEGASDKPLQKQLSGLLK